MGKVQITNTEQYKKLLPLTKEALKLWAKPQRAGYDPSMNFLDSVITYCPKTSEIEIPTRKELENDYDKLKKLLEGGGKLGDHLKLVLIECINTMIEATQVEYLKKKEAENERHGEEDNEFSLTLADMSFKLLHEALETPLTGTSTFETE